MIPLSATCINNWYFKLAPACPQPLHTDAVRPKRTTYGDISLILRSCFVFPKLSSISSRNLCSPTIDQAHVLYTSGFQHLPSTRRRVHSSLVVYNDKRIIIDTEGPKLLLKFLSSGKRVWNIRGTIRHFSVQVKALRCRNFELRDPQIWSSLRPRSRHLNGYRITVEEPSQ
ncbi:hypothetical protein CIP107582_01313 [Corynebacterium diphtheriae]|nr:hypothetical protein CIP107582_01313 [Corynebacterium diphtheriae]